jgi:error-prone DNA polymerase
LSIIAKSSNYAGLRGSLMMERNVNVIIRPDVLRAQRREVLGASMLGAYGVWQREGDVQYLVARRLVDLSGLLGGLATASRDFC